MKRNLFSIFVYWLGVLTSGLCLSGAASAQTISQMSTDQILQYSLDSLRSKMDSAVNENRKLSAKNTSIRKRILFLKKEMRELDDKMIHLKEDAIDVKNTVKIDAKELKVDEKHLNSILERKRHLMFERDTLKKRIETQHLEQTTLKQDIEDASFDVQDLKGSLKGPGTSNLLDFYSDEKAKFLDMVRESRARITEKRQKMDKLQVDIADAVRAKKQLLLEQQSLERTISDWDIRLKEEEAHNALLGRTAKKSEQDIRDVRKSNESKNQDRRNYRNQLISVIRDMNVAHRNIATQFEQDQKDMNRYLSLLEQENELLFQQKETLERTVVLQKKKGQEENMTLILTEQQRQQKEQNEKLAAAKEELQNKLAAQQEKNASLKRDEERLQNGLQDLGSQVEKVKKTVTTVRKDAFGQKKAELEKAFKEQQLRVQKLSGDIASAQKTLKQEKQKAALIKDQALSVQDEVKKLESDLKDQEQRQEDLLKQQKQFSKLSDRQVAAFKKGLEDARMRKKALEASYDVVQKKYQATEEETASFAAEQRELERYLDVLKKENSSLQRKLDSLDGGDS